jgi:hypothetical protein
MWIGVGRKMGVKIGLALLGWIRISCLLDDSPPFSIQFTLGFYLGAHQ